MTAPLRRKRRPAAADVPAELAEWFAGVPTRRRPLLFKLPHYWQVAEQWRTWLQDNPTARPPAGWEWMADTSDPRHRRPPFFGRP